MHYPETHSARAGTESSGSILTRCSASGSVSPAEVDTQSLLSGCKGQQWANTGNRSLICHLASPSWMGHFTALGSTVLRQVLFKFFLDFMMSDLAEPICGLPYQIRVKQPYPVGSHKLFLARSFSSRELHSGSHHLIFPRSSCLLHSELQLWNTFL